MSYRDHGTTLPTFKMRAFADGQKRWQEGEMIKWSGEQPPPAVGSYINVPMNRLGRARVEGYFEDCGWLGLKVRYIDPPAWFTKQNGTTAGHVFGAEIEPA